MERQHHLEGMVGALTAAKGALQSCSSYPEPHKNGSNALLCSAWSCCAVSVKCQPLS